MRSASKLFTLNKDETEEEIHCRLLFLVFRFFINIFLYLLSFILFCMSLFILLQKNNLFRNKRMSFNRNCLHKNFIYIFSLWLKFCHIFLLALSYRPKLVLTQPLKLKS